MFAGQHLLYNNQPGPTVLLSLGKGTEAVQGEQGCAVTMAGGRNSSCARDGTMLEVQPFSKCCQISCYSSISNVKINRKLNQEPLLQHLLTNFFFSWFFTFSMFPICILDEVPGAACKIKA